MVQTGQLANSNIIIKVYLTLSSQNFHIIMLRQVLKYKINIVSFFIASNKNKLSSGIKIIFC